MYSSGINYTKCVVIVHGKSELKMVQYIKSNLHLPIKIYAKKNGGSGGSSIQIGGLLNLLNSDCFKSQNKFLQEYTCQYDKNRKMIMNFKLFIIMDTDDCSEELKSKYINGELFDAHWLKPYIVPIYNINNIEDVMLKAGIMKKKIKSSDKGSFYTKVFPINEKPLSFDTVNEIITLRNLLKKIPLTNLDEFINFCLDCVEPIK